MKRMFRTMLLGIILLTGLHGLPAVAADAPEISAKGCVLMDAQTG